jgi:hypothetical protein
MKWLNLRVFAASFLLSAAATYLIMTTPAPVPVQPPSTIDWDYFPGYQPLPGPNPHMIVEVDPEKTA